MVNRTKRREFIKKSILGTASVAVGAMGFSSKSYASIIGANERINVAVVGIRSQGGLHINSYCAMKDTRNVKLKTICDVDEQYFPTLSKTVFDKTGVKPLTEWDMRKVFDDKDIDVVSFAVPNHWHALATIWALQAGKHVYVEKPASHNIFEGRKMVEAANKYDLLVQVGFNNRSFNNVIDAIDFLHNGGIGEVYMARGLCFKPRDSFGIAKDSTPPASLHYDLWLGPAPYRPYNEKRGHYNWHWFWDTGNGDTGNQGPHQFDIARWGLNKNEHPVSAYAAGGVYGIDPKECAQETPNTLACTYKYSDGKMLEFETRGGYTNPEATCGIKVGNIFYGTEGHLELGSDTLWKAFRKRENEPFAGSGIGEKKQSDRVSSDHWGNFIDAVRSGKKGNLNADILEGHYSSALAHLANISYRLGRELKFNGASEKFVDDPEADSMLSREEYRKPFVVPPVV